jgi:acyl-CoA-binding protein
VLVDGVTGSQTNELCAKINELCIPPPDLEPTTACVCRQMWDWANPNQTSAKQARRRLNSMVQIDADPPELEAVGSLLPIGNLRILQGNSSSSTPADETSIPLGSDSTTAGPAIDGPGPWQDTMGEYCNAWHGNTGNDTQWCYVNSGQQCHQELMEQAECTSTGTTCYKSGGPCTDSVDSRSLVVIEGLEQMNWPVIWATVLGTMLLLCGACAIVASHHYQRMQRKKKNQWAQDANKHRGEAMNLQSQTFKNENDRFEEAQREAVRKLKDSTPQDIKLLLYGYYMQAKEGDARGVRPSLLSKERAKWDAWNACKTLTREQAIDRYVKCVDQID